MILFQKRFHEGIVGGTVTLTFRAWPSARVKPGGRYRCHPIGVLEVDAVDRVPVASIIDAEALAAGFADREELIRYIREVKPDAAKGEVFRIRFHHGGDGDRVGVALDAEVDDAALAQIKAKLAAMDHRSSDGAWTARTLSLIQKHPRIAASKLAPRMGMATKPFKANVVKLKKLGLTQSFEVGYELSPRGAAFVARSKRRKKSA
jgi:hypothetical protein